MMIAFGEKNAHIYMTDGSPVFFKTEEDAKKWASAYCDRNPHKLAVVGRVTELFEADIRVRSIAIPQEERQQ